MAKKSKIEGVGLVDSILSLADRSMSAILLVGATFMSAWMASLNKAMEFFAPFSYLMAGFLGLLIMAIILALYGLFKERTSRAKYQETITNVPQTINPLDDTFTRKKINLNDFKPIIISDGVSRKTITECELLGPAVIAFYDGCTLVNDTFIECDFIKLTNKEKVFIKNVIAFRNCTISNSKMYGATILVTTSMVDKMPDNANWITDI